MEDFVTNEFLQEQLVLLAIVMVVMAILTLVLHLMFGRTWAGNELARRVMGHALVLVVVGVPAMFGSLDFFTWLVMCIATIVGGGIVGAIEVTQQEKRRVQYVEELKAWAASMAQQPKGEEGDGADIQHRE